MKKWSFWMGSLLVAVLVCMGGAAALAQQLSAPTGLAIAIEQSSDPMLPPTATLSWDEVTGAEGYRVYTKLLTTDGSGTEYEFVAETSETEYTFDSRFGVNSAAYAYRVTAFAGSEESEPSNVVSSACGRAWNEGDLSGYVGSGITQIVSSPALKVVVGETYEYDANALGEYSNTTPSGAIVYEIDGPEGMSINPSTGVVEWTPHTVGKYAVAIIARRLGVVEFDEQVWNVDVVANMTTGVAEGANNTSVVLQPNPASSVMNIRFASVAGQTTAVSIVDMAGQTVRELSVKTSDVETVLPLNVSSMAHGVYFLRITSASGATMVQSFTVVR